MPLGLFSCSCSHPWYMFLSCSARTPRGLVGRHVRSSVNFSPHFIEALETKRRATPPRPVCRTAKQRNTLWSPNTLSPLQPTRAHASPLCELLAHEKLFGTNITGKEGQRRWRHLEEKNPQSSVVFSVALACFLWQPNKKTNAQRASRPHSQPTQQKVWPALCQTTWLLPAEWRDEWVWGMKNPVPSAVCTSSHDELQTGSFQPCKNPSAFFLHSTF